MNDLTQPLRVVPLAQGTPDSRSKTPTEQPPSARDSAPQPVADRCDFPTLVSETNAIHHPTSPPISFPGYELLGEIGRGGMGVVYKARQRSLNRLVALKVILAGPHASSEDRERFRIEAEAAARLQHPNIVQVYDIGEHAGFSYMALELIEGSTLRNWQAARPVDPRLAAHLIVVIARAVQHAHDNGIIHRDLKPANILLHGGRLDTLGIVEQRPDRGPSSARWHLSLAPIPKITDFGLAKSIDGGADLTVTGVACGTPNYMAPEQIRGGRRAGPGVDVYGLGAVLYELLCGHPPFSGTNAIEVMEKILKTDPPALRKLVPSVPHDLAVIVAKCLEKDPARRYPSPSELADDLERFLAGRAIKARPIGILEQGCRWVRRNPVPTAFLCLLSLGCLGMGALAVALYRSEAVERAARVEANAARTTAELTRDELRLALAATEAAKAKVEREQAIAEEALRIADLERRRALEQTAQADAARTNAEENLNIASAAIRNTLFACSNDPRLEAPEFRDFRLKLIDSARRYRDQVAAQLADTVAQLDDLADVSHWLGYLEYLNDDQPKAASEYLTAVDAACRWIAAAPNDPEPRVRMADSLVNAGNAFYNYRRFAEADLCYRQAMHVIDSAIEMRPDWGPYHRVAYNVYAQLANQLRMNGTPQEQLEAIQTAFAHAREFVRLVPNSTDALRVLAVSHVELARTLVRLRKWDEAECYLTEAVTARKQVLIKSLGSPRSTAELAGTILALAEVQNSRGHAERAASNFEEAIGLLERAHASNPENSSLKVQLAEGYCRQADALRHSRQFEQAENSYNHAIAILDELITHKATHLNIRQSWAKARTGRAHVYNLTGRHREAIQEWARLAQDDPNPDYRFRADLFVAQSLLFAQDWMAAARHADQLAERDLPNWMRYELGRVWCLLSQQIAADERLTPDERLAEANRAVGKAINQLEIGKAQGLFQEQRYVQLVTNNPEFAPVRGKFNPHR